MLKGQRPSCGAEAGFKLKEGLMTFKNDNSFYRIPQEVEEDLKKSNLDLEDIKKYNWSIINTTEINAGEKLKGILGFTKYDNQSILKACNYILVIPYPQTKYSRARLYPPINGTKYLQPSGITPSPYILPEVAKIKNKPHKPVIFTEGEKKTLCLLKHGFNAIGLPGVWTFKSTKQDLPFLKELEDWNWQGRTVHICFDSDAVFNPNVRKAQLELSIKLWVRDALVKIIQLPQPNHIEKYGVDDLIEAKGLKQFQKFYKEAKPFYQIYNFEHSQEVIKLILRLEDEKILNETKIKSLLNLFGKVWKEKKETYHLYFSLKMKPEKEKLAEDTKKQALALLKNPNLIDHFLTAVGHDYVGREKEKILLKLVATGRKLQTKQAIGCIVKGTSSVGKSTLVNTVLKTCDPEDILEFTRMSANYLLYRREPVAHKILTTFELHGIDDVSINLRTALSEGKLKIGSVNKENLKVFENEINAEGMVFITTTTKTIINWELGTRIIELEIEHCPHLAREVYMLKADNDNEKHNTHAIWQAADRLLEPRKVVIPYASALAEVFPTHEERFLRDFEKILFLIKASALLHQFQREEDNQKRIIATIEDYKIVYSLQSLIFQSVFEDKLRSFLDILKNQLQPITRSELVKVTGLSESTIKRRIKQAREKGLIETNGRGSKEEIELIDNSDLGHNQILPEPNKIFSNLPERLNEISENVDIVSKKTAQMGLNDFEQLSQISQKRLIVQNSSNGSDLKKSSNNVENVKIVQSTTRNKKIFSNEQFIVIKPFSWRGRNYLQSSLIKEGDFTLGELQALKDAGHIKPIGDDKDILISF